MVQRRRDTGRRRPGFTLAELVMVCAVMVVLAAVALPLTRYSVKRSKEIQLQRSLREMRNAIDEYKRFSDLGLIPIELGTEGYPAELEDLVEGVELVGTVGRTMRFLRRIPVDPMTGEAEWGRRSLQDDPDGRSWGGENVYDVHSLSEGVGMNGIPYAEW